MEDGQIYYGRISFAELPSASVIHEANLFNRLVLLKHNIAAPELILHGSFHSDR
jgi:hypothetical protein